MVGILEEKGEDAAMKPIAIVYTSNTGHTAAYATLLAKRIGLPTYAAAAAKEYLQKGTPVIYLGWLFAGVVKGYRQAAKRYHICAVCGVGLSDTGSMHAQVRKANKLPDTTPLFTLQGGMDYAKLKGINKLMIDMLTKTFLKKQNRTADENKMLSLLQNGGDYVEEKHLAAFLGWYK